MSNQQDTPQNRVSARVVEDAYVSLQDRMRTYRQARDQGNHAAGLSPDRNPVVVLQDAVQTFFEFIRPFIKNEPRLAEYWRGAIATHPDQQHRSVDAAKGYYRDNSFGVWQIQPHTGSVAAPQLKNERAQQIAATDGGAIDPGQWHDVLQLPDTTRILRVEPAFDDEQFEGWYYVEGRFAVVGLREIPTWNVATRTRRTNGDGFMAGESAVQEQADPEPAGKVETAARMLVEVADELDAIATYSPRGERVHGTPVPDS